MLEIFGENGTISVYRSTYEFSIPHPLGKYRFDKIDIVVRDRHNDGIVSTSEFLWDDLSASCFTGRHEIKKKKPLKPSRHKIPGIGTIVFTFGSERGLDPEDSFIRFPFCEDFEEELEEPEIYEMTSANKVLSKVSVQPQQVVFKGRIYP